MLGHLLVVQLWNSWISIRRRSFTACGCFKNFSVVASAKKLKINSDLLSELIALGILPEEPPVASETEGEMKEIA